LRSATDYAPQQFELASTQTPQKASSMGEKWSKKRNAAEFIPFKAENSWCISENSLESKKKNE
jgi:hypothetical protein